MTVIQSVTLDAAFMQNPLNWLAAKAKDLHLQYLLLHSDEGVTWGRLDQARWTCSFQAFPYELDAFAIRAETIQQARLFDEAGEVFVWRIGQGFGSREILDQDLLPEQHLDECYWLWGTGLLSVDGFTLMNEGQQGFHHAPPVDAVKDNQRLGLKIRHYLAEEEDGDGWQWITTSRLVGFEIVEGGEK